MNTLEINGEVYIKKSDAPKGNRCVVVVDRGWIFAGDVERSKGRIKITNAVWVFRWESIGFDGVIANPEKATIKPFPNGVDLPRDAEIFCVPVHENWGLKDV